MLVVLSPAKKLDFDSPLRVTAHTRPVFLDQANELAARLQTLGPDALGRLMKLSAALAELNAHRYAGWVADPDLQHARQAVLAFDGDVYAGLQAGSLDSQQMAWAQDHLALLSGLYGVLRPLDLIQPHRLEMGTRLETARGANLYAWWGGQIADELNRRLDALAGERVLVNLASAEYFRSVQIPRLQGRVIECVFQDLKDGAWKVIGLHAKRARGLMARHIIEQQIESSEQLRGFAAEGYAWHAPQSDEARLVFRRGG
ncbi:peroxide stress protein YaaA [Castellaniella sp.]|uniref:peroxide stress protein YaaA n=1 Tax=Castellaniella sp. TaxID=1955812 RepID=UPI00355FEBDF